MPSQDAETLGYISLPERRSSVPEHGDIELMLSMLGEYTQKLRDTYKSFDRVSSSRRYGELAIASIFYSMSYVVSVALKLPWIATIAIAVVMSGLIGKLLYSVIVQRWRHQFEREELILHAASLARLIRTTSMMHEHGLFESFAQKLALDLKIGEAEVVLQQAMRYVGPHEAKRIDLIVTSPENSAGRNPQKALVGAP